MTTNQFAKTVFAGFVAAQSLFAAPSEIGLSYRYKDARTMQVMSSEKKFAIDPAADFVSDNVIDKTLFVAKIGKELKDSLTDFSAICAVDDVWPAPVMPAPVLPTPVTPPPVIMPPYPPYPIPRPIPEPDPNCQVLRNEVASDLLAKVDQLNVELQENPVAMSDEKLFLTLDLFRKLAGNMRDYENFSPFEHALPLPHGGIHRAASLAGGLNVTAGGAQDFAFVRKLINDGYVPSPDNLDLKGFMGEFDLSFTIDDCHQLICVEPVYKVDQENNKLFVQVAKGSNINEADFARNSLNLALVIDISGSMHAMDETEKSRLQWAKDAAVKTVSELSEDDYLSVVVFDSESEVLVPATKIESQDAKDEIIAKINALETKGSTNLYAGLESAYQLVSDNAVGLSNHDSRIILISDAGLNTGVVDEAETLSLVSDHAAEGIGLTAIGLGENFNQDFVLGITKSMGGNYLYVHSGKDMYRYFDSFDFLVSPVAYHFKASLDLGQLGATFVNSHGLPGVDGGHVQELINVQTLFFTNQGGGAILLEYDL